MPIVDDHGVDCVVKKIDGTFVEIQTKACSKDVASGDAALFAAITHEATPNYYFVFYSERMDMMWIMSSEEFLKECNTNKTAKTSAKEQFNRTNEQAKTRHEYCHKRFEKYIAKDFSRFH